MRLAGKAASAEDTDALLDAGERENAELRLNREFLKKVAYAVDGGEIRDQLADEVILHADRGCQ